MEILKKENWWVWLILAIFTGGASQLVLAALLNVFDRNAWYFKWTKKCSKWFFVLIGVFIVFAFIYSAITMNSLNIEDSAAVLSTDIPPALLLISIIFMALYLAIAVFYIQILTQMNAKLKTPGSEVYLSPYVWILCLIIPIIGWIMAFVMSFYLSIWYLVMLYRGEGEHYLPKNMTSKSKQEE